MEHIHVAVAPGDQSSLPFLFAQNPMDQSMAVCTKALEVVEGGFMAFRHLADMGGKMVDFDTCFGRFGPVMRYWVEAASFARKPSVCSTVLRFLCTRETGGSFSLQVTFNLCAAFTPFPVDVSFAV